MKYRPILPSTLVIFALFHLVSAEDVPSPDAMKAAREQTAAYVAAFNKGDAKALAAMYAEDAQYDTEDGALIAGRPAVQKGLAKFFTQNKDAKLDVRIDSARFLTPDVLIEKGISTIGDESTRYVCNYVKKDGKWLISELSETTLPPRDAAAQALEDLSWMVGSWKDKTPGATVSTQVAWTKNRHFLRRSFTIAREGEDAMEGTELIGYDPEGGQIRSWLFDSEGGFGEGTWKRENNKWLITARATGPDGTTSTAQHVITFIDDKRYTWESINRQSVGEVLPNLDKIEVVRTAAE